MIKSRAQLKKYFDNGCIPDGNSFASLIDSTVHQEEYTQFVATTKAALAAMRGRDALVAKQESGQVDFPKVQPQASMSQKTGLSDPGSTLVPPSTLRVPADGKWHPVLSKLCGCFAFEVTASAASASDQAVTHAIAVTSFSGRSSQISQTKSGSNWRFWRRISLRWRSGSKGYDLCVKTGSDYGPGADGKPAMIAYRIRRLW